MLLAMDVEIIFFIVAAIIATISKLHEKSKQVRAKSLAQQRKQESRERLELIPEPVEPASIALDQPAAVSPALSPPRPVQTTPLRPRREASVRPPRRTRRVVTKSAPAKVRHAPTVDTQFVQRLGQSRRALREAIMLREILGPPVAMRGYHFPRR